MTGAANPLEILPTAKGLLFERKYAEAHACIAGHWEHVGGTALAPRLLAAAARALGEPTKLRTALRALQHGAEGEWRDPAIPAALWLDVGRTLLVADLDAAPAALEKAIDLASRIQAPTTPLPARASAMEGSHLAALVHARGLVEYARYYALRYGPSDKWVDRMSIDALDRMETHLGLEHPFRDGVLLLRRTFDLGDLGDITCVRARVEVHRAADELDGQSQPALEASVAAVQAGDLRTAEDRARACIELEARARDERVMKLSVAAPWHLLTATLAAQGRYEESDEAQAPLGATMVFRAMFPPA